MSAPVTHIRGVTEPLPVGETVLWQGSPTRSAMARHVFHTRTLTGYFAVVITGWVLTQRGTIAAQAFTDMLLLQVSLALAVIGFAHFLAWLSARTTVYAVTDHRVVLKVGMVLPMTINIPFRFVDGASVRLFRDGSGQIALQLPAKERLAYLALWPHVRPWRFTNPEPMLRGLSDPSAVGTILRDAVAAAGPITSPAAEPDQASPSMLVPA
jgi:hypothetical protein